LKELSQTQLASVAKIQVAEVAENLDLLSLLDAMRSIIFYVDRDAVVVHGNITARRWAPSRFVIGSFLVDLIPDWRDVNRLLAEIAIVSEMGTASWGLEFLASTHGVEHWFRVDLIPTKRTDADAAGAMIVIDEISESVRTEYALQESEARYKAFIANSSDAIWCYSISPPVDIRQPADVQVQKIMSTAVLAECNVQLAKLFGANKIEHVVGARLHRSRSVSTRRDVAKFVENGYRLEETELQLLTSDGKRGCMQSSAIGVVENGFLTRAWGITRDITERRNYIDKMEHLANHDALTQLPNRELLYSTIERALERRKDGRVMALMLIDLDRFKEINDTLGHVAGDEVLKQIGPRLKSELSEIKSLVARLGGDEFAVFLPSVRSVQQVVIAGHRLLDCLCDVFELQGSKTEISASIGISTCPHQAEDVSTLMRYADVAMYHAKKSMKGVALYDSNFDPHSPVRLALMGALGKAVRENELLLHYQPKVSMERHHVYGLEALVRWNHSHLGFVPPEEFIPIAEMSNMIYPMTYWVMENAIRTNAALYAKGYRLTIAVNLSPRTVTDDRLLTDLSNLLKRYQLPSHLLELEITESLILLEPDRAFAALKSIGDLGVKLAIDDFGTGYSSLAYLKRLPVQTLKIDKSFVLDMLDDEQDEIIVNSTINLAHNLGLSVVAEGVECEAVYQRLSDHHCDCAQGYHIAPPMNDLELESWLKNSRWTSCP